MEAQNTKNIETFNPYLNAATVTELFDRPTGQWNTMEAADVYTEITERGLRAGPETPEYELYLHMQQVRRDQLKAESEEIVAIHDHRAMVERWQTRWDTVRKWLGVVGVGRDR